MQTSALRTSVTSLQGRPVRAKACAVRRCAPKRASVFAKYGDESQFFDLNDLENTIGSWDLYGQEDKNRYNGLQSEFFERAAGGLTRREYLAGLVALFGGGGILLWGARGSSDTKLPITVGPKNPAQPGPRGRL
eukprot:scaffold6.g2891.t1